VSGLPPGARLFEVNNVPFEEVNITRDRAAAAQVRSWTGGVESTPPLMWAERSWLTLMWISSTNCLGSKAEPFWHLQDMETIQ